MDQEQHYTVYAPSLQAHNRIRTDFAGSQNLTTTVGVFLYFNVAHSRFLSNTEPELRDKFRFQRSLLYKSILPNFMSDNAAEKSWNYM